MSENNGTVLGFLKNKIKKISLDNDIENFIKTSFDFPLEMREIKNDRRNKNVEKTKPSIYSENTDYKWLNYGHDQLTLKSENHELVVNSFVRGCTFTLKNKNDNESDLLSWVCQKYEHDILKFGHDVKSSENSEELMKAMKEMLPELKEEQKLKNENIKTQKKENKIKKKSNKLN